MSRTVPSTLTLGAATAAYQIEGATHEGGRRESIWDAFARVPGAVIDGHNGDVACNHYHRWREDIALMKDLGVETYRFSVAWPRLVHADGTPNHAGADFYRGLVDALNDAGIAPWLTLYHWDLPQDLEDAGGWTSRDTTDRFAEYAEIAWDALGDRVPTWTTLNEPWCSSFLSYTAGAHAPGRQSVADGLAAAHHLLLAHGKAVQALRARGAERVGITLNMTVADPVDPGDLGDIDAARRIDEQFNRVFIDPIFRGAYPETLLDDVRGLGLEAVVREGDLATISAPIDSLGVNYYHGDACSYRAPAVPLRQDAPTTRPVRSPYPAADGVHTHPRGFPTTNMGWEVQPEGLTRLLRHVHEQYTGPAGVELWVTENGSAWDDVVAADGRVHDADRTAFLRAHLGAILDAMDAGVPVKGYFAWSLLDNFEWAWGYHKRFGFVRVDYDTQARTVKDSGLEYARIIRERTL